MTGSWGIFQICGSALRLRWRHGGICVAEYGILFGLQYGELYGHSLAVHAWTRRILKVVTKHHLIWGFHVWILHIKTIFEIIICHCISYGICIPDNRYDGRRPARNRDRCDCCCADFHRHRPETTWTTQQRMTLDCCRLNSILHCRRSGKRKPTLMWMKPTMASWRIGELNVRWKYCR